MRIRAIDLEAEYDQLSVWWTKRGLVAPAKLILQGACGFAVNAGVDVVMGWVYVSGNVGFLEWITGNPSCAASGSMAAALGILFDFVNTFARSQGCNILLCGTQNDGSLSRFMATAGWTKLEGQPHQFLAKAVT